MEKTDIPKGKEDANHENRDQNFPISTTLIGIKTKENRETPECKYEYIKDENKGVKGWIRNAIQPLALSQIVGTLIALGILIFYMCDSRNRSKDTIEALKRSDIANANTEKALNLTENGNSIARQSLIQSKQSADSAYEIAKQSLDISRQAMREQIDISRTDLRPYLCFDAGTTKDRTAALGIETYKMSIWIKNFGSTPAYDFTLYWATKIKLDFTKESFPPMMDQINRGAPIIPPGDGYGLQTFIRKNRLIKKPLMPLMRINFRSLFLSF